MKICSLCGKSAKVGNSVSHANNKTKRLFRPNLQMVRALIGAAVKRIRVCTDCIKSGRVTKKVKAHPA